MTNVKSLVSKSQIKKYSDGGATDDMPPTPKDDTLRRKHISDSIPYNTAHAFDHLEELCNQADKLSMIDKPLASKLVKQSLKKLEPLFKKMEKYV